MGVDGIGDTDDIGRPDQSVQRAAAGVLCTASAVAAYRIVGDMPPVTGDASARPDGALTDAKGGSGTATDAHRIPYRSHGMAVVDCDGIHIGVVDRVDAVTLSVRLPDDAPETAGRPIPIRWVRTVDQDIHLRVSVVLARAGWAAG